jgi:hypothetical protein
MRWDRGIHGSDASNIVPLIQWMEEILHHLIGGLSHYRVSTIQGGAGFRSPIHSISSPLCCWSPVAQVPKKAGGSTTWNRPLRVWYSGTVRCLGSFYLGWTPWTGRRAIWWFSMTGSESPGRRVHMENSDGLRLRVGPVILLMISDVIFPPLSHWPTVNPRP